MAQMPAAGLVDHPGRKVYESYCAHCHGNPQSPKAHTLDVLRKMNANALQFALTEGVMSAQGGQLTQQQRESVVSYLAAEDSSDAWIAKMMCAADRRHVELNKGKSLTRVAVDENNSRHMTAEAAGLTTADMANLELAWVVAFPNTAVLRSAPVIIDSAIFYAAVDEQKLFALDTDTGCVKWVYHSPTKLRSSLAYGELDGVGLLVLGDNAGFVHAVNAITGKALWVKSGQASNNYGQLTGSPVFHADKIIVPISGSGANAAANPQYECCENHGAVVALNASNGEKIWEYHTMPVATYNGMQNSIGVKQKGPSGAPIWSTPTVDAERGLIYLTTGENTSHPTTNTSDAIIAIDLETGKQQWVFQAFANDMWNYACLGKEPGPNCILKEDTQARDFDFGGPAMLIEQEGKELLIAGQKSSDLWALDPDDGSLVWRQRVGNGTALGGNHWGVASDYKRVFLTISDPVSWSSPKSRSGIYTFSFADGEPGWFFELQPDCDNGRKERIAYCHDRYGFSAAPLSVDGAVIAAGLDGRLFIFDSENGDILFQYDTARDFETVNGIAGKGGAIDSHSIAAGSGMLFIGSGYGLFRQAPGNALLAFKPKKD